MRLAQAAGEKRNINGFCFIKCPDAPIVSPRLAL
ncbi:hypothetical protein LTSEINV_1742, partial [Salmonella enterica subsp. enterica serovar Inverness str. R8-3668]